VLWDIDYTLLHVGGMSSEVFAEAFSSATGRAMDRLADLPGKTDRAIITETLELNGETATSALVDRFADALADGFGARAGAIRATGHLFPGAAEALRALAGRPDIVQSVLTGNMRSIAEIKLAAFDVGRYVDFAAGAYGMDGTAVRGHHWTCHVSGSMRLQPCLPDPTSHDYCRRPPCHQDLRLAGG
jgi:phosphoglycolate phosphatase-like HAD superfamily hydrolase